MHLEKCVSVILLAAVTGTVVGQHEEADVNFDAVRSVLQGTSALQTAAARGLASTVQSSVRSTVSESQVQAAHSQVKFNVFTRNNSDEGIRIYSNDPTTVHNSTFDASRKTFFCIHGYVSNTEKGSGCDEIKNALLEVGEHNVILVDWSQFDNILSYPVNVLVKVPTVGQLVGETIKVLLKQGAVENDVHLIGHSLGAHVAAFAGSLALNGKGVITGLDPAGPMYGGETGRGLSANDAGFVEAIHTDGGKLGIGEPVAHLGYFRPSRSHLVRFRRATVPSNLSQAILCSKLPRAGVF